MKKLMQDNASVSEADLRTLAEQRAAAVRNWFKGKVKDDRIFVVSPKIQSGSKAEGPRVAFSLKR